MASIHVKCSRLSHVLIGVAVKLIGVTTPVEKDRVVQFLMLALPVRISFDDGILEASLVEAGKSCLQKIPNEILMSPTWLLLISVKNFLEQWNVCVSRRCRDFALRTDKSLVAAGEGDGRTADRIGWIFVTEVVRWVLVETKSLSSLLGDDFDLAYAPIRNTPDVMICSSTVITSGNRYRAGAASDIDTVRSSGGYDVCLCPFCGPFSVMDASELRSLRLCTFRHALSLGELLSLIASSNPLSRFTTKQDNVLFLGDSTVNDIIARAIILSWESFTRRIHACQQIDGCKMDSGNGGGKSVCWPIAPVILVQCTTIFISRGHHCALAEAVVDFLMSKDAKSHGYDSLEQNENVEHAEGQVIRRSILRRRSSASSDQGAVTSRCILTTLLCGLGMDSGVKQFYRCMLECLSSFFRSPIEVNSIISIDENTRRYGDQYHKSLHAAASLVTYGRTAWKLLESIVAASVCFALKGLQDEPFNFVTENDTNHFPDVALMWLDGGSQVEGQLPMMAALIDILSGSMLQTDEYTEASRQAARSVRIDNASCDQIDMVDSINELMKKCESNPCDWLYLIRSEVCVSCNIWRRRYSRHRYFSGAFSQFFTALVKRWGDAPVTGSSTLSYEVSLAFCIHRCMTRYDPSHLPTSLRVSVGINDAMLGQILGGIYRRLASTEDALRRCGMCVASALPMAFSLRTSCTPLLTPITSACETDRGNIEKYVDFFKRRMLEGDFASAPMLSQLKLVLVTGWRVIPLSVSRKLAWKCGRHFHASLRGKLRTRRHPVNYQKAVEHVQSDMTCKITVEDDADVRPCTSGGSSASPPEMQALTNDSGIVINVFRLNTTKQKETSMYVNRAQSDCETSKGSSHSRPEENTEVCGTCANDDLCDAATQEPVPVGLINLLPGTLLRRNEGATDEMLRRSCQRGVAKYVDDRFFPPPTTLQEVLETLQGSTMVTDTLSAVETPDPTVPSDKSHRHPVLRATHYYRLVAALQACTPLIVSAFRQSILLHRAEPQIPKLDKRVGEKLLVALLSTDLRSDSTHWKVLRSASFAAVVAGHIRSILPFLCGILLDDSYTVTSRLELLQALQRASRWLRNGANLSGHDLYGDASADCLEREVVARVRTQRGPYFHQNFDGFGATALPRLNPITINYFSPLVLSVCSNLMGCIVGPYVPPPPLSPLDQQMFLKRLRAHRNFFDEPLLISAFLLTFAEAVRGGGVICNASVKQCCVWGVRLYGMFVDDDDCNVRRGALLMLSSVACTGSWQNVLQWMECYMGVKSAPNPHSYISYAVEGFCGSGSNSLNNGLTSPPFEGDENPPNVVRSLVRCSRFDADDFCRRTAFRLLVDWIELSDI